MIRPVTATPNAFAQCSPTFSWQGSTFRASMGRKIVDPDPERTRRTAVGWVKQALQRGVARQKSGREALHIPLRFKQVARPKSFGASHFFLSGRAPLDPTYGCPFLAQLCHTRRKVRRGRIIGSSGLAANERATATGAERVPRNTRGFGACPSRSLPITQKALRDCPRRPCCL